MDGKKNKKNDRIEHQLPVINAEDSKKFIREFNHNKPSPEFLESCSKAGELFHQSNRRRSTASQYFNSETIARMNAIMDAANEQ